MDTEDTIAAIASAPGGAMRGVLRVSGPEAVRCVARCLSSEDGRALTAVRRPCVVAGQLLLGDPLGAVPCAFYVWPGRQSYTRQPSVEMHTFGSPPVLDAALRAVCAAAASPSSASVITPAVSTNTQSNPCQWACRVT